MLWCLNLSSQVVHSSWKQNLWLNDLSWEYSCPYLKTCVTNRCCFARSPHFRNKPHREHITFPLKTVFIGNSVFNYTVDALYTPCCSCSVIVWLSVSRIDLFIHMPWVLLSSRTLWRFNNFPRNWTENPRQRTWQLKLIQLPCQSSWKADTRRLRASNGQ